MKKNEPFRGLLYHSLKKSLLIMRIAIILLLIGFLQTRANDAYSQKTKLSIDFSNTELVNILDQIENQTEFYFLYNEKLIDANRKVSINVKDQSIEEVLKALFSDTDVEFSIIDRKIILAPSKIPAATQQQQKSVSGKVTDSTGGSLPGVSVAVKGTSNGTITDANGIYSLTKIPENGSLVFSFVGMKKQEIKIGAQTTIDVVLAEETVGIEEVVAVGYGTQRKKDLTGAFSSIKAKDLVNVSAPSFTSSIQGKIPGVYISQTSGAPGGSSSVRIRGIGTTGGNEPLYVIDGFPIGGGAASIAGSSDKVDGLSIINPNDIESIQVLKDAASAAIYGARAANGVILITTKRGKEGNAKVVLNASTGFQQLWKNPEFLNAEEFATLTNELYKNSGMTPNPEWANPSALGKGTNWIDLVFRNAKMQNYDLSISGGTQKLKTSLSLGYLDQDGTMIETFYKRYTGRVTADLKVNDKLDFGGSLAFTVTQAKAQQNSVMNYGIFNLAQEMYPTLGPNDVIGGSSAYYTTQGDNPLLRARSMDNQLKDSRVYGNAFGEYKIMNGLKFKTNLGIDSNNGTNTSWNPSASRGFYVNPQAVLGVTKTQGLNLLIENTLSYSGIFQKHNISAVVGQTAQKNNYNWISVTARNFPNEQLQVVNSSTLALSRGAGSESDYALASYLGRVNYSYNDKYLLSASFRRDGSSNFGPNNKWGDFYAVSGGWNISSEEFMKKFEFINSLKIRGSWGQLGNDAIGSFGYLSTIRSGSSNDNYVFGTGQDIVTGSTISRPGNPDLKWETSEQTNFGIDGSFFKDKLTLTADYYIKNTLDMLISLPVSVEAGFQSSPVVNGGKVQNKGFELVLGYKDDIGALHFDISGNISTLSNVVKSLGVGRPISGPTLTFTSMSASYTEVGQPIGYYRGYVVDGIYQSNSEVNKTFQPNAVAGDFKYRDVNKDGLLSDLDKVKLGKPWPDIMYGVNLNLSYKGFDLSVMLQGVTGNQIFNSNKFAVYPIKYFGGTGVVNAVKNVLNRWTPEKGGNSVPGLKYVDANGNYANLSSFYIEDGAYMRIRNVVLGYTIPSSAILKTNMLQSVRIYVSAQNLFTFTHYSGFDPEVGSTDPIRAGIDDGVYPIPRTFMTGININF